MECWERRGDTFGGQGYVSQLRFEKQYVILIASAKDRLMKEVRKVKFTKLEAIQEMVEIGSHSILLEGSEQLVNDICEPFGITPRWVTFNPSQTDPKGAQPNWDSEKGEWDWTPFKGVDGHSLARLINQACGGKGNRMLGRGSAYREDLSNAKAALTS